MFDCDYNNDDHSDDDDYDDYSNNNALYNAMSGLIENSESGSSTCFYSCWEYLGAYLRSSKRKCKLKPDYRFVGRSDGWSNRRIIVNELSRGHGPQGPGILLLN